MTAKIYKYFFYSFISLFILIIVTLTFNSELRRQFFTYGISAYKLYMMISVQSDLKKDNLKLDNAEKKISSKAPINSVSVIYLGSENQDSTDENLLSEDNINLDNFRIETITNKEIYIHVATLLFKHSAEDLQKRLKSVQKVDIVNSMINGRNTYKVIIGPFENLVQLNEILKIDTIQQYEDLSIFLK